MSCKRVQSRKDSTMSKLTRRDFGVAVAAGAAAPALIAQQAAPGTAGAQGTTPGGAPNPNTSQAPRRGPAPEVPPFSGPIEFTRKDVPARVRPFGMTQVKLLPSIYTDIAEWNRGYMSRLPADRL